MGSLSPPAAVVLVAVLIAAVTDLRSFRIHNLLTLPLLATGLAYHGLVGGVDGLLGSLAGAGFGFGMLFLFYLVGGMGGGDLKLVAGIGAWLGVEPTAAVVLVAALAGGLFAVVQILAYGRLREAWVNLKLLGRRAATVGRHLAAEDRVEEVVRGDDRRRRAVPFGAMLGIGLVALIVLARVRPGP